MNCLIDKTQTSLSKCNKDHNDQFIIQFETKNVTKIPILKEI